MDELLLEDGSGSILLEDGSGSILLEDAPATSGTYSSASLAQKRR